MDSVRYSIHTHIHTGIVKVVCITILVKEDDIKIRRSREGMRGVDTEGEEKRECGKVEML